jgi:hypothetical protein
MSEAERIPRALIFAVLAVLWVFPSIGALAILFTGEQGWRQSPDVMNALRAVALEQWLAVALLVIHALFTWAAWNGGGFAQLRRGIGARR